MVKDFWSRKPKFDFTRLVEYNKYKYLYQQITDENVNDSFTALNLSARLGLDRKRELRV